MNPFSLDTGRHLVRRKRGAPHTQPDVEARPMVGSAPAGEAGALGAHVPRRRLVANAIRGSNEATAAGRSRDSPQAGVAPNPIEGPRDTGTCALQSTASNPSLPGHYLSRYPTAFPMKDAGGQQTD
jgi:hypothetical protein